MGRRAVGGPSQPNDLEEAIRRFQEGLRGLLPGGLGGAGGLTGRGLAVVALVAVLIWLAFGTWYTVWPNEVGLNLVFGRYTGKTAPGLNANFALADRLGDQGSRFGSADHRGGLPRRCPRR